MTACNHAVPSQCSMSAFAPTVVPARPSSLPAAQASVPDVEVTLKRAVSARAAALAHAATCRPCRV
jgi:hypothetical protein